MTNDDKVRLRTKDELKAQNEGLAQIKKILDEIGVVNYLSSGTLLGAVRDGDFIPWDWDVQMYLITENAYPLRFKINHSIRNAGFVIHKFVDDEDGLKWDIRRDGAIFELTSWYLEGKWRYRKKKSMRVPAYLFNGEYEINFKNLNYRTLNPPEEYLKFCYDDWRTPIRTADKEIYSNQNHLRYLSTKNKFFYFISNFGKIITIYLLRQLKIDISSIKIFIKKKYFSFFILRLFYRIFYQPLYKTFSLFTDFQRLMATLWVERNKKPFDSWAINTNKNIFDEASNFYSSFIVEKKIVIKELPISGGDKKATEGGEGNEKLLYFLTRLIGAKNVLETGVSAGASTRSILEAIKLNNQGKLYSSDLATVLKKSQVGILVKEDLKKNWCLYDKGDEENIPLIFQKEKKIDLVYYDSVKSYEAKKWFHSTIVKNINPKVIIYDDIDRDSFFRECVDKYNYDYKIFDNAGVIFNTKNNQLK